VLVVQALLRLAGVDIRDVTTVRDISTEGVQASATVIVEAARAVAEEEELDGEWLTSRRVGRILAAVRLLQEREGGSRQRRWIATQAELWGLARAYGIATTDAGGAAANVPNGRNVPNVPPPVEDAPDDLGRRYPCPGCDQLIGIDEDCPRCDTAGVS
jgi:hypothetical protein